MKTAIELYPEYASDEKEWGYFCSPSNYQPILDEFGEILVQVDDEDSAGDSRVLYRDDSRFGWLQFGWGSCSGSDALQGCSNMKEVQELIDSLQSEIEWFDSQEEAIKFFETHDWEGDYSWREDKQKEFVQRSLGILRAA